MSNAQHQLMEKIELLTRQLRIAEETGNKALEGNTHEALGLSYKVIGRNMQAKDHHKKYLKIAKQIKDKRGEGNAHNHLGDCYVLLSQYDNAVKHCKMALDIAKEIGNKVAEGSAMGNLGTCFQSLGQYDKAIEYYEVHLKSAKQIGDKDGEGSTIGNLGSCYQYLDQYDKALKYLEMQLNFAKQMKDNSSEAISYNNLGNCYCRLGQYDKAEECYRESVESFEKLFKNAPQQDQFKVSILDTFVNTYPQLVAILLRQEMKEEALVIAERGRSRALAELLINTRVPEQPSNVSRAKGLERDEILQVVKALDTTVLYYSLLKHEMFTWVIHRDGNGIDVCSGDLLSLMEKTIQSLDPSSTVKCEDRSLSFLYPDEPEQGAKFPPAFNSAEIPVESSQCHRVPGPASNQHKQAAMRPSSESKTREDMGESEWSSVLKDLFEILLKSVRQFLKGSQVVVVPDGPLALVPFAALVDGDGQYVAETLQVRLVPSLATAKMIMERPEETGQTSPLIVGDPDVGEVTVAKRTVSVDRLPFAKAEAEMIGQLLNVEPLTGAKATKENLFQSVESASLVHIAAHGDMERGEILLARSPGNASRKLEDVMLTISDLEHKRLRANLVVLSCCHSGRGKVRAEGVIGIGRAFLGAGARAVLVTLWAVDDEATKYFMRKFYQHLICGKKANKALNEAMKAMRGMEKFRHPRHWAPFVLVGEDVAPFGQG